ncbi:hypothetical protein KBC77_02125 [Candidatus Saccharibacteria bacterium]|nr:hypothetical protein [Candidatus Saccharibacteria bacterium]
MSEQSQIPPSDTRPLPQAGGDGYAVFSNPDTESKVYVMGVPTEDGMAYLIPEVVTEENEYRVTERVGALAFYGIGVRRIDGRTKELEGKANEGLVVELSLGGYLGVLERFSGGSEVVAEARRAFDSGEQSELLDSLNILARMAVLEEKSYGSDQDQKLYDTYKNVFKIEAESSHVLTELAEKGLEAHSLTLVADRLANGVDGGLLEQSVKSPDVLRDAVMSTWKECIDLAFMHNTDLADDGVYTEIHKVGDVLIPVPAISSVAFTSRDSSLGYVDKSSGHTLVEMYNMGPHLYSDTKDLDTIVFNKNLLELIRGLGLEYSAGKTLQRRCVTVRGSDGEPVVVLTKPLYEQRSKLNDEQLTEGLVAENIQSQVDGAQPKTLSGETHKESSIRVNVTEVEVAGMTLPNIGELGVLGRFESPAGEDTELAWFYGTSGWHGAVSQAAGVVDERIPITIEGKQFRMIGRYQWDPMEGVSKHSIALHVEGNPDDFGGAQSVLRDMLIASGKEFREVMTQKTGSSVQLPAMYMTLSGGKGVPIRIDVT